MPKDPASIAKVVSFVDHGQLTHGVATPLPPPPQLQIDQIMQWYHPHHHYLLLSFIGAHFPLPDPITLPKLVQNPMSRPLIHETKHPHDSKSRNIFFFNRSNTLNVSLVSKGGRPNASTRHSYSITFSSIRYVFIRFLTSLSHCSYLQIILLPLIDNSRGLS